MRPSRGEDHFGTVVIDLALLWTLWPRVGLLEEVSTGKGEARRRGLVEVTQRIGDEWLASGHALALAVPSAIVPEKSNYLLNATHPRFGRLRFGRPMPFRLWLRKTAYERLLMIQRHHVDAQRRAVGREVALPDRSSLLVARRLLPRVRPR